MIEDDESPAKFCICEKTLPGDSSEKAILCDTKWKNYRKGRKVLAMGAKKKCCIINSNCNYPCISFLQIHLPDQSW